MVKDAGGLRPRREARCARPARRIGLDVRRLVRQRDRRRRRQPRILPARRRAPATRSLMTHCDLPMPVSFEFFPPNTPVGSEKLKTVVARAGARASPEFFSVTYGAGGATRDKTLATVRRHRRARPRGGAAPARASARRATASPRSSPPTGRRRSAAWSRCAATCRAAPATAGEFRYASELIAFIRETQGRDWHIEVAAYPEYHPQQRYAQARPAALRRQGEGRRRLGDHAVLLQPRRLLPLRRRGPRSSASTCRSCPASCRSTTTRRSPSSRARDGIEIPRWVALKMEGFIDDAASIRAFGLDVVDAAVRAPDRRRRAGASTSTR